jgi:hypothetical protein
LNDALHEDDFIFNGGHGAGASCALRRAFCLPEAARNFMMNSPVIIIKKGAKYVGYSDLTWPAIGFGSNYVDSFLGS